jgi:hypothetical protein
MKSIAGFDGHKSAESGDDGKACDGGDELWSGITCEYLCCLLKVMVMTSF